MADLKISQLTGATTPLGGTEVLPIVQSGATKQVSVANLTAGRTQTSNGIVQGAAGTGYNFTANTPAAGMTSQLLNAYEEGTFTATLTCGTSGTITLNSNENTLSYTRIGRVVYVSGQVAVSAVSSPTGTVALGTLPFASASLPQRSESALFNVLLSNTTTNTPTFFGRINAAGATSITILAKDNTGALNASPASLFAGGADVWISGFYLV